MAEEIPIRPILWGLTIAILAAIAAHVISGDITPDPLRNLTTDEYRQSYSECIINSTCNLYLGPGAVHACITNCMRTKITNSTDGNIYPNNPLVIGGTVKQNSDVFRNIK